MTAGLSLAESTIPADIDQKMPPVRTDVTCPVAEILLGVSTQVQQLIVNVHQFSARERSEHTEIARVTHTERKSQF